MATVFRGTFFQNRIAFSCANTSACMQPVQDDNTEEPGQVTVTSTCKWCVILIAKQLERAPCVQRLHPRCSFWRISVWPVALCCMSRSFSCHKHFLHIKTFFTSIPKQSKRKNQTVTWHTHTQPRMLTELTCWSSQKCAPSTSCRPSGTVSVIWVRVRFLSTPQHLLSSHSLSSLAVPPLIS